MRDRTTFGLEVEAYTISIPDWRICREIHYPKRGSVERGERFTKDVSIGIEYNSKVFLSVREALFLLKSGLRKYMRKKFERPRRSRYSQSLFLTGGWRDRFAGVHLHIGRQRRAIKYSQARVAARLVHDHIPFLIAITANSPVWREEIKKTDSNRILRGTKTYFTLTKRGQLPHERYAEMTFNRGHSHKPNTLELRIFDTTVPEFICAALAVIKILIKNRPSNKMPHERYIQSRVSATMNGPEAKLYWNHRKVRVRDYVDIFFRKYRHQIEELDLPKEVLDVFRLLKKGWNGARILRRACRSLQSRYPRTWQRHFAHRYTAALERLLDGGSIFEFSRILGVRLPNVRHVRLG